MAESCRGEPLCSVTLDELNGCPITSIYSPEDVTDYIYYDYRKCPLCEKGVKLDALVNA